MHLYHNQTVSRKTKKSLVFGGNAYVHLIRIKEVPQMVGYTIKKRKRHKES